MRTDTNDRRRFIEALEAWEWVTGASRPSTGLRVDQAIEEARHVWQRILDGETDSLSAVPSQDLPDVLHGLAAVISEADPRSEAAIDAVVRCFKAVDALVWPEDHFGEKSGLLSTFSYLVWRQARRTGLEAAREEWERRTVDLALSQPWVRDFLEIPAQRWSNQLTGCFFQDPVVVFAYRARLGVRINLLPVAAWREAIIAYDWMTQNPTPLLSNDERHYFLASFALTAGAGCKHCGDTNGAIDWLATAERHALQIIGSGEFRVRITFVRLSVAYERHQYDEVAARLPALLKDAEKVKSPVFSAKCRLLEAMNFKEMGEWERAMGAFERLLQSEGARMDPHVRALSKLSLAGIRSRRRDVEGALALVDDVSGILADSDIPPVRAHAQAVRGEILRDHGVLGGAIDSYRAAAHDYAQQGMASMAVYTALIAAETLLVANREAEAMSQLVALLPVVDELELVGEGVAIVGLLREAIRRSKADPETLRALKSLLSRSEMTQRHDS